MQILLNKLNITIIFALNLTVNFFKLSLKFFSSLENLEAFSLSFKDIEKKEEIPYFNIIFVGITNK